MSALFRFPDAARVEQRIPKTKLVARVKMSKPVRAAFDAHVEIVTWSYLLAKRTVQLAETPDVPEIDVLTLKLATPTWIPEVLSYLDTVITKPTLFELVAPDSICFAATYKRPSRSRPGETVTREYYVSAWEDSAGIDGLRQNLPAALDLERLYHALLRSLLPIAARPDETIDAHFTRTAEHARLTRELTRLRKRYRSERQFNLRIALNAEVRAVELELMRITTEVS